MKGLLAPAGSPEMLGRIFEAGADAGYAGLSGFCRKEREAVDFQAFGKMISIANKYGKKLIAAFNLLPSPERKNNFFHSLQKIVDSGVYGVILNDPGLISKARSRHPDLFIMASVGLSPLNFREVNFIGGIGANTVLLSEFLSPEEIALIRRKTRIGLEFFARGLKEFCYTGKCILSSYYCQVYKKGICYGSAKRGGTCADVCKEKFKLTASQMNSPLFVSLPRKPFQLDPEKELKPVLEYADVFKIWQGDLSVEELLSVIRMYSEILTRAKKGGQIVKTTDPRSR